jgi:DpnII restriction endonuclease
VSAPAFDDYVQSLAAVSPQQVAAEPEALDLCARTTAALDAARPLDKAKLAELVAADPATVPVLAAVAGFSQERFKTWLQANFGTAGWITLGRTRAADLVDALARDFALIPLLEAQADRSWTWADILARIMSPRQQAGAWVQQGRDLEDAVEQRVATLGVSYVARTRFTGAAGRTAPADFAIPNGPDALIAVGVKGFDSTGSKLSDAAREIEEMVAVKTARQFVFAVVDGQGWLRRQSDLRRIHKLWADRLIDGLFTQSQLGDFETALHQAAKRLGLV